MQADHHASIEALSPAERNFLAGLALLGAPATAADRLILFRDECARLWREWSGADTAQRRKTLAALVASLSVGFPVRVAELHPSWLADVVAFEPSELVLAIATVAPPAVRETLAQIVRERGEGDRPPWRLDEAVLGDLARLVFAPLESMLDEAAGPLGRALGSADEAAIIEEMTRRGARVIGLSLAGAPLVVRARAMAAAGSPWAGEIATAAAALVPPAERHEARRQVARAAALVSLRVSRLLATGLIALSEALAAEGSASILRVAGRLPLPLARPLIAATCA